MKRNLLPILMSMVLLSPLAIDIYLPSLPTMAQDFAVSNSQVQSTLILFLFAMGVGQIIIGPLADRFGRRPIALFGVCLYILSSLLAVVSKEFQLLQLARVLQGLAACSTSIVVFSAVRDCYSVKDGAKIYSYLNGAICVIPALAPTLGGVLALHFGWRSTFAFMMLYGLIMLVVVLWKFPETRPANTITDGALYRWARYKPVLTERHFLFYAICCMTGMGAILTYVSYAPVWLIGKLGVSELAFSGLFGVNAIVNIAACFGAPWLIKKLGNRPTVIFALALLVVSAVLQFLVQEIGPQAGMAAAIGFMLPMGLLCIGFALLLGPATSMALSAFGERAGTAAAMLGFIQMSGASLLAGLIQQTSLTAPFAVITVMGGGAIILLAVMSMKRMNSWHVEQVVHD
ncbi:multidrug effflux MFS transporter [Vibrio sp. S11_S32]|uniref:multidrug effflux MFS transporter n=1 Tax=Vibrio sp. S11_S32 TaxID=2720225 RepID=UPI001680BC8F|nr:multidrug effflux MFS transporter [Vibrio sp. S11_S32]MBD1577124.1 multidrug effflux MFS transporter [Vibrio sp. S11_S32]